MKRPDKYWDKARFGHNIVTIPDDKFAKLKKSALEKREAAGPKDSGYGGTSTADYSVMGEVAEFAVAELVEPLSTSLDLNTKDNGYDGLLLNGVYYEVKCNGYPWGDAKMDPKGKRNGDIVIFCNLYREKYLQKIRVSGWLTSMEFMWLSQVVSYHEGWETMPDQLGNPNKWAPCDAVPLGLIHEVKLEEWPFSPDPEVPAPSWYVPNPEKNDDGTPNKYGLPKPCLLTVQAMLNEHQSPGFIDQLPWWLAGRAKRAILPELNGFAPKNFWRTTPRSSKVNPTIQPGSRELATLRGLEADPGWASSLVLSLRRTGSRGQDEGRTSLEFLSYSEKRIFYDLASGTSRREDELGTILAILGSR